MRVCACAITSQHNERTFRIDPINALTDGETIINSNSENKDK